MRAVIIITLFALVAVIGLAVLVAREESPMPQVKVWLEVTGNGRREKMLRFQSVQSPPVHKKCYTVSVNGEYLIGLTTPGRNHIGYYADEAEEAMQEAVNQAVTDLFEAAYDDYCETSNEPGCLYAIQPGSHSIEIDDHPIGGAHWVQANAVIHIGQGFEKGDPKCDPDDEFPEDGSWPRLEVQVTAPTRPDIYLRPFFESLDVDSIPAFTHVDAKQKVQDFIDACLALPNEDLVVTPETAEGEEGFTFNLDENNYLSVTTRTVNVVSFYLSNGVTTDYVQCVGIYGARSGDWVPDTDMTLTLQTDGYVQVQTTFGVENNASSFFFDPISFHYSSGTEEVGFKEVFELRQSSTGDWELAPVTSTNPEGAVWENPTWVAKPSEAGIFSNPSGTMRFDLSLKSFEVIDPGDNPACRWNLHYLMRNPETGQCGPQVYDLWSRPDTRFPPKMYPLCSVTVENVLPSEVPV